MSFRRQPSNKLQRCPWSRMKLLVNEMQVQILPIQRDTIYYYVIAYSLPGLPYLYGRREAVASALVGGAPAGARIVDADSATHDAVAPASRPTRHDGVGATAAPKPRPMELWTNPHSSTRMANKQQQLKMLLTRFVEMLLPKGAKPKEETKPLKLRNQRSLVAKTKLNFKRNKLGNVTDTSCDEGGKIHVC